MFAFTTTLMKEEYNKQQSFMLQKYICKKAKRVN